MSEARIAVCLKVFDVWLANGKRSQSSDNRAGEETHTRTLFSGQWDGMVLGGEYLLSRGVGMEGLS